MPRLVVLALAIALLGILRRGSAEARADLPPRIRLASTTPTGGG